MTLLHNMVLYAIKDVTSISYCLIPPKKKKSYCFTGVKLDVNCYTEN